MSLKASKVIVVLLSIFIASCANTSLIQSWKEAEFQPYQHLMIIAISDSQQTRQIYEKHFVDELKKNKIKSTPSYELINSKREISRETVIEAIVETDIDAVLVTYLVSAETEFKERQSPLNTGYSADVDSNQISATIVSNRGQSREEEVFVLKNDIYDAKEKKLIWSVRTKTVGPESVDEVVTDVTALLIKQMFADGILK